MVVAVNVQLRYLGSDFGWIWNHLFGSINNSISTRSVPIPKCGWSLITLLWTRGIIQGQAGLGPDFGYANSTPLPFCMLILIITRRFMVKYVDGIAAGTEVMIHVCTCLPSKVDIIPVLH